METIEIEKIQKLRVDPGETLVVTLSERTSADRMKEISEVLRDKMPDGVEVLIVSGNVELSVVARTPEPAHS